MAKTLGLELKASKTRITHTLKDVDGKRVFDFLGFNIRQYKVGKKSGKLGRGELLGFKALIKPSPKAIRRHVEKLREVVKNHKGSRQEHLIYALNRVIRGWTNYYSTVVSKQTFAQVHFTLTQMLRTWAKRRHPNTGTWGVFRRYCRKHGEESMKFQPPSGHPQLHQHVSTPIRRHVKVQLNAHRMTAIGSTGALDEDRARMSHGE